MARSRPREQWHVQNFEVLFLFRRKFQRYNRHMDPTVTQHIELRKNRRGEERPFIAGTRVRVQDIVSDHEQHGMTAEEIVREFPHISLSQVHSALSFYFEHREEIRSQMRSDASYVESVRN